jgi:integrase
MAVKVRQRNDGSWWIFIDHQGHRKAKKIGTGKAAKQLAERAAVKITARLLDGDLGVFEAEPAPAPAPPTFAEVYREWIEKYPALNAVAPTTLENHRSFADRHLLPFFGAKPITAITVAALEDFIEAKRAPGGAVRRSGKALADSSLKTGLLTLRLVLKRAARRGLIPSNPMNELEWRSAPRIDQVDPFRGRELQAILSAAEQLEPDFAAFLRLWAQSGCRAGEVAGLQWQDVDLNAGTIKIRRTWTRQRLGPTKTRQERDVSILHPIADDTPEWQPGVTQGALAVIHGLRRLTVRSLEPEAFVFQRRGRPWPSVEIHRAWRRVLLAASVRYRVPEQLRHTFASTMLSRNAPLLYVQQQGGWRSASVLLRTYARWMPQPSATQTQPAHTCRPGWDGRNTV